MPRDGTQLAALNAINEDAPPETGIRGAHQGGTRGVEGSKLREAGARRQ